MEQRTLIDSARGERRDVSVVALGTWQLGGADWGDVSDADAEAVMAAAFDAGVTFFDTADVYGDGLSERRVGEFLRQHQGPELTVATKMGRRVDQMADNYTLDNFRAWTDRSRRNLGIDRLELVQLHCPPIEVIEADATYDALDALVADGAIGAYGVSVETVEQALAAIRHPRVASVQIVLNAFRLKPLEEVLPAAADAGVGIIARVPLASGLLSGRYDASTTFATNDHRTFNRHGEAFDQGETFSGVEYDLGLEAAERWKALLAEHGTEGVTPAQAAIAWVAQQPGVSTVIPGARSVAQAQANAAAGGVHALPPELLSGVREIYDDLLRGSVHARW